VDKLDTIQEKLDLSQDMVCEVQPRLSLVRQDIVLTFVLALSWLARDQATRLAVVGDQHSAKVGATNYVFNVGHWSPGILASDPDRLVMAGRRDNDPRVMALAI
jgi:hypothetical protein